MKDTFITPLNEDECRQQILETIKNTSGLTAFIFGDKKPIRGWLRCNSFTLYKKQNYGNIFFPIYHGTIIGKGSEGTEVVKVF